MSEHRRLLKNTGLLSLLTLLSRFTGLIRDILLMALLGASRVSSVFLIAFELSNLARRVLGEGALSAFVVPIIEKERKTSREAAFAFISRALNAVALLSAALTLAGIVFAPLVFNFFGGAGMLARAATLPEAEAAAVRADAALGVSLTRLMFPNLIALAAGSVLMGACNAAGSFAAPALGSVMLNLAMIAAAGLGLVLGATGHEGAVWLGWSVLAGAALRVLIMVPGLRRQGWRWSGGIGRGDPAMRELFRMMGAGLFGMSVAQINMSLVTIFATWMGDSEKAYLTVAQRLIQFPMALTAASMATAMLPNLSRAVLAEDHAGLRSMFGFVKRAELVLMAPAAAGLMLFALPITRLIFERGKFTAADAEGAAAALVFYAPGLIAFGWQRVTLPYFLAKMDRMTPVKTSSLALIVNLALGAAFTFGTDLGVRGLALANTIAGFTDYALLSAKMRRDPARPLEGARFGGTAVRCAAAALLAIGLARLGHDWTWSAAGLENTAAGGGAALRTALRLAVFAPWAAAGGLGYFALAHWFGVPEARAAFEKVLGKFRGRGRAKGKPAEPAP